MIAIVRSSVASTFRKRALRLVTPPTVDGRLPVRLSAAVTDAASPPSFTLITVSPPRKVQISRPGWT